MGAFSTPFETLPLGFRFKPTDVELIDHYLRLKINGKEDDVACIKEVDICRVEPWDLPDLSAIKTNDHEWFYFCPRDRKYPNGQRSNRATEAGYWKATGKDRTIKSRKMGLIGMKKTLVFYTGRAPKGQRTNWVIHEYRTTLQELDGSHPGQGAFVLCRLFKKADELKQDDNDEASHSDEVETNILSPNLTNISQEDIRSEPAVVQASPLSVENSVEQQVISENCNVKTCDSLTSDTMYTNRPQMNEEMLNEVDSHFDEPDYMYDPPESYFKWQSTHANQGLVGMDDIFPADLGHDHYGFQLQDISGNDPISNFLDSVINPDALVCEEVFHQGATLVESDTWKNSSIKETGSCSGSDVEVAQQQHDVAYVGCITSDKNYNNEPKGTHELFLQSGRLADDDDIFSEDALNRFCNVPMADPAYYMPTPHANFVKTEDGQVIGNNGIKLRTQLQGRQLPPSNFAEQGTAARRIRLQMTGDEGFTITEGSFPVLDSSATVSPGEDFLCLEDLNKNTAVTDESESVNKEEAVNKEEVVESGGIKLRTHRHRSRLSPSKSVEQGTALRRIRLLKNKPFNTDTDDAKLMVADISNLSKEAGRKTPDGLPDQKHSSVKRSAQVHMIKIVMFFVFTACVGLLWIAPSVFVVSS